MNKMRKMILMSFLVLAVAGVFSRTEQLYLTHRFEVPAEMIR
jgi:hypothetical protein